MEKIKLIPRTKKDGTIKELLKNKKIPCVVYGKNIETQKLSIELKTVDTLVKNNTFYSKILSVELNNKTEKVLPKEVQFHPVSDNVIHIDFMRVQDTTKVTVEVPVNFLNRSKCPGIKQGGVLNTVRRVVEFVCNADNIPESIEFDLINSEIGDSIKISNINLPDGVKPTITDRDFVIATLVPPTIEAEPEKTEETKEEGEGESATAQGEDKKESATAETKEGAEESKASKESKPPKKEDSK